MIGIVGLIPETVLRVVQCFSGGSEKVHIIGQTGTCISKIGRFSRYCQGVTELDMESLFASPQKGVEVLQATCDRLGIDFLIPAAMPSTFLLAEIKDQLKGITVYPCPSVAEVRQLSDKLQFARELDRLGLPQPQFWELTTQKDIDEGHWTYPVVVKPLNLENGVGIRICNNAGEISEHLCVLESLDKAPYLVQEYIPGIDMDLTVLADHGKVVAWTVYSCVPGKWSGKVHRFEENAEYLKVGTRLVEALNYHGILHIDGRLSQRDGSIKLIECNPRMFGSVHSASFAGVNFVTAGTAIARGGAPAESCKQVNGELNSIGSSLSLLLHGELSGSLFSPISRNAWLSLIRDPLPLLTLALHKRFNRKDQV